MNKKEKCYKLDIDPRILELLGPNLYTNIYYILAELIANAYDADAHNVYIIDAVDHITVEDDGRGMSYENGEVNKFLRVAAVSRTSEDDSKTKELGRLKMGRKGIGKLAALSVSDNVYLFLMEQKPKILFIQTATMKYPEFQRVIRVKVAFIITLNDFLLIAIQRKKYMFCLSRVMIVSFHGVH